ncbi:MAG: hypothetical protein U0414_40090 [Polyangiaceae bacterium]
MALVTRPFPPALPHGPIQEVLPGIHFVTGTLPLPGPLPVRASRNMTIVREGDRLVLVNTVRLDEAGLAALDRLGRVTDILRIAGNHGMDDPFYADRYKAKVTVVKGQRYTEGFGPKPDVYFMPDDEVDATSALPIEGAKLYTLGSKPPEALLLLERHGGVCVAGDCFQHWHTTDEYFSLIARGMMRLMGFIKPYNVGPAWLSRCKPSLDDLRGTLSLPFSNVLPAHGAVVLGDAREKYRPAVERALAR